MKRLQPIRIGNRRVGPGQPTFVIAEAGVNHDGNVDVACALVDAAVSCGGDAVKFQAFRPELLVTARAGRAPYQRADGGTSQLQMLQSLALGSDAFATVARHAAARRIMFLATPFDHESLGLIVRLGAKAVKLGSGEVTNHPLLRAAAQTRLPILLSTGMATLDEVAAAVSALRRAGARQLLLFHCVSAYPAAIEDMNLKAVDTLRTKFNVPCGLSDHTTGALATLVAMGAGAAAVEKHLTLDKLRQGPDHKASFDPVEFSAFVQQVRQANLALGDGVKRCTPEERRNVRFVRRSCVALRAIPRGARITREDIIAKRPAGGISPVDINRIVGRRARRPIAEDTPFTWAALER